ncbi:MAG: NADH-quinone oxidoreductase subunit A [Candidatus Micrarchaeia archaeon]
MYFIIFAFALFSILVPLAMVLANKLIGMEEEHNAVKDSNYESAENSIGENTNVMSEYFHFLTIFVAFEIAGIVVILWSITARSIGFMQNIYAIIIFIFSIILAFMSIGIAKKRWR